MANATASKQPSTFGAIQLQVGTKLTLQPVVAGHFSLASVVLGYSQGEYLLVKLPLENGLPAKLYAGERFEGRLFSKTSVFTFAVDVVKTVSTPFPQLYLSFPESVFRIPLRASLRVKVDYPASIPSSALLPSGLGDEQARLTNLSLNGAGVFSPRELGAVGDPLSIAFKVDGVPEISEFDVTTDATIRSSRTVQDGWHHGIEFKTDEQHALLLQNAILLLQLADRERIV